MGELLGDLYADVDWSEDKANTNPYFLGSIVLSKTKDGPDLVLDGQQRLTTISLLLAVLKQKLKDCEHEDANHVLKYLESGQIGKKKTPKVKLQPEDIEIYTELLKAPKEHDSKKFRRQPIAQAVRKIDATVDVYLEQAAQQSVIKADAVERMIQKILYSVEFVRIVAPSESEAFRLFETLNDRGLALSAADLIKNKLFAQCSDLELDDAKETWQETIDLVGTTEVVHFLRYFWIATRDDVRKDKLFDVFRDALSKMRSAQALELAKEIKESAEAYRHIANPDPKTGTWGSDTAEGLQRLVTFRARSCRPLLLACAKFAPGFMPNLVKACESITIRYSIIGDRNPNQLEKIYGDLCRGLREKSDGLFMNAMREKMRNVVPLDSDFEKEFAQVDVDKVTSSWREVLIRLNGVLATGETRIEGSRQVHVEHILPKSPSDQALKEAKIEKKQVEEIVGSIGNLTLLSGRKNREISNGPFSRKQPVFASSEIALNQEIANTRNSMWGEEQIKSRSKTLAQLAVKAWPWPVI